MSKYYNPRRTRNLYDPAGSAPFKLSRSKIDLFVECPRCFYLDRRLGVGRPPGFPFTLNNAVDTLLKKEFDIHRLRGSRHPLMEKYGIDALPIHHEELEDWRENFKGIQHLHEPTNLLITGAIDDLWQDREHNFIVVDYKATSKNEPVTALDRDWHDGYKRQMEIYQWLLRKKGYSVSNTGYFIYCNGQTDREAFDGKLEFDVTVIPYRGDDGWVDGAVRGAHRCLSGNQVPEASKECDYCAYVAAVRDVTGD